MGKILHATFLSAAASVAVLLLLGVNYLSESLQDEGSNGEAGAQTALAIMQLARNRGWEPRCA